MKGLFRTWVLPVVVGGILFLFGRPILAQIAEDEQRLRDTLAADQAGAGSAVVNDYQQVYYERDGKKVFVTDGNRNSHSAVGSGEYLAWVTSIQGAGQIFLYHIPTRQVVQLTGASTNLNPKIDGRKVVWERWVNDRWHVFFFDGIKVSQLTDGDMALNPEIEDDTIVFARRNAEGAWRAERYTIDSKTATEIASGLRSKFPRISHGKIFYGSRTFREDQALAEAAATATPPVKESAVSPSPSISSTPTPSAASESEEELADQPLVSPTPLSTPTPTPRVSPTTRPSPSPTPVPAEPEQVTEEEITEELAEALPTPTPEVVQDPSPAPAEPLLEESDAL